MQIAVIGAGKMGGGIARRMAGAGHEVAIANSRGPETLGDVAADTGARPTTVADAVRSADVVFLAMPYYAVEQIAADGAPWDGRSSWTSRTTTRAATGQSSTRARSPAARSSRASSRARAWS